MVDTVDPGAAALDTNVNQQAAPAEVAELEKGLGLTPPATTPANPTGTPGAEASGANGEGLGEDDDEDTARRDPELEQAATDEEREAIRERRRHERKDRRTRAKERQATLERTVQALTTQNQQLAEQMYAIQNANTGAQLAQVDAAIAQANQAAEHFKSIVADATTKGDGRTAAEATEAMIAARNRASQLAGLKQNAAQQANRPKPLNPIMVSQAKNFLTENSWYGGPQSQDPDSRVLNALDNSLAAEGWDPTTNEYWQELKVRGAKYLPHRFGAAAVPGGQNSAYNGANGPRAAKTPVAGSGGDSANVQKTGGVTYGLSAERVKAIKDAGAWDDPKRRDSMIKRYQEYDKSTR